MTTPTDDNPDLLTVIATMKAAPGKEDELRAALEAVIPPTRQEDGCVNYDLHESVDEPGLFAFYENWDSVAHHDAHNGTAHLAELRAALDGLLDGDAPVVARLRRIA
ncbi:MAG: antibiotic biosynthesis monooxygenase [Nitriliruptoraceae bacterium]|nr:antibiotic biosynthesis monooxygenase [Nitriliruptoraceae bacterium]